MFFTSRQFKNYSAAPPPSYEAQENPPGPQLELFKAGMAPSDPEPLLRSKEEVADMSFFVFLESHFGHRTSKSVPKTISSNAELHL